MNKLVFIKTFRASRGKGASVRVYSKDAFVEGKAHADRYTQWGIADSDKFSDHVCSMHVDKFEEYFTNVEIEEMKENGMLSYYPQGIGKSYSGGGYMDNGVEAKFPIFRKEVYLKYGVALDPKGELL